MNFKEIQILISWISFLRAFDREILIWFLKYGFKKTNFYRISTLTTPSSRWILKKSKSWFLGFPFLPFFWDLQNYSRHQWSFLRALSLRVGNRCSWEQSFSNPVSADFPIKPKERKSKDIFLSVQIRVLILRFVANPKSGFLNQNPDFPIGHVWCLLRTRDFSLIWHPVLTWRWIKMAQR